MHPETQWPGTSQGQPERLPGTLTLAARSGLARPAKTRRPGASKDQARASDKMYSRLTYR